MTPEDLTGLLVLISGVVIVLALLVSGFKRWLAYQESKLAIMAGQTAEKAAQYAATNKGLEGRLRVVEAIVTDKGYDVGLQIEALRSTETVRSAQ